MIPFDATFILVAQSFRYPALFEAAQEPFFLTFHGFAPGRVKVIEAGEMENSVNGVARQFFLPSGSEFRSLDDCVAHGDIDFTA
jgi:hypothetical protein